MHGELFIGTRDGCPRLYPRGVPKPDAGFDTVREQDGTSPQRARHHLRDSDADDARGSVARAGPIIAAVIAALLSSPLSAREYRSREVTREFQREHPCPSTGQTRGACPGYRKDHVIPLACLAGRDSGELGHEELEVAFDRGEIGACLIGLAQCKRVSL